MSRSPNKSKILRPNHVKEPYGKIFFNLKLHFWQLKMMIQYILFLNGIFALTIEDAKSLSIFDESCP